MAELLFRTFKDVSLRVMVLMLERVKLSERKVSTMLEEMDDDDEDLQLQTTSNFKADHVDAYDSDCNDEATAYVIFMESLFPVGSINGDTIGPSYDSELLFEVSSLVKEREHIKLEYKKLYDSIKQTRAQNKHTTDSLQQKLNDQIFENAKLKAKLQAKFSEPLLNQNGTSVNTKFAKPSTSGTKLYSMTPFPKTQFIPKVVEKNDLSKIITSHLHTNKVIEKCIKVLAPGLLKIEFEPINAYFKNNRAVHRDYLKVTKEHVETLQVLLEQARALKPSYENLDYAYCNLLVKNDVLSSNSETNYVSCNEHLFSSTHDACVVKYLNDVNKRKKAKSVKQKEKIQWKPTGKVFTTVGHRWIVEIVLWYLDSRCSKHITSQRDKLISFVSKFIGLGHNLFSVRKFYESDLEVAFRKHTCFIRNLDGVDLLSGSRDSNLYTISLKDMMKSSLICLLSKASKTKSWLWHRRLSHLNFNTINQLAKQDLV
ncbi:integrase, catalytic region, zinc finger, CCHC-type containing protein [Tanacetum coccineum]